MKHEQIRTWFNLKVGGETRTVRPYNAETTRKHKQDVSWSHGFTHFEIRETGKTGFCGTQYFEDHAKPLMAAPPRRKAAKTPEKPAGIPIMRPLSFRKSAKNL